MGSRASTLLRDEEIEEIKKETGCECGARRAGKCRGGWVPEGGSALFLKPRRCLGRPAVRLRAAAR